MRSLALETIQDPTDAVAFSEDPQEAKYIIRNRWRLLE